MKPWEQFNPEAMPDSQLPFFDVTIKEDQDHVAIAKDIATKKIDISSKPWEKFQASMKPWEKFKPESSFKPISSADTNQKYQDYLKTLKRVNPKEEKIFTDRTAVPTTETYDYDPSGMTAPSPISIRPEGNTGSARDYAVYSLSQETNIPASFIDKHLDDVTKELGIRGTINKKELVDGLMQAAIVAGIITNPVSTTLGVGSFMAVKEAENAAVQKLRRENYKYGQGREVKEFAGDLNEGADLAADVAEFVVPGIAAGGITHMGKKSIVPPDLKGMLEPEKNIPISKPQPIYNTGTDMLAGKKPTAKKGKQGKVDIISKEKKIEYPATDKIVPAIVDKDGTVVKGDVGDMHVDIIEKEGIENPQQRVFVDKEGNTLNRQEATEKLKQDEPTVGAKIDNEPLHSEDLNKARGKDVIKEVVQKTTEEQKKDIITTKTSREEIHNHLGNIQDILDDGSKTKSIGNLEKYIEKNNINNIEGAITGFTPVKNLINKYKSITRSGMKPEEYRSEKEDIWTELTGIIDSLEVNDSYLKENGIPDIPVKTPKEDVIPSPSLADKFTKSFEEAKTPEVTVSIETKPKTLTIQTNEIFKDFAKEEDEGWTASWELELPTGEKKTVNLKAPTGPELKLKIREVYKNINNYERVKLLEAGEEEIDTFSKEKNPDISLLKENGEKVEGKTDAEIAMRAREIRKSSEGRRISGKEKKRYIKAAELSAKKMGKEGTEAYEKKIEALNKESAELEKKITKGIDTDADIDRLTKIEEEKAKLGKSYVTFNMFGTQDVYERTANMMKEISGKISSTLRTNAAHANSAGSLAARAELLTFDRSFKKATMASKLLKKAVEDIVPDKNIQMQMIHAFEHEMKGSEWDTLGEIEKGVVRWLEVEKQKIEKYINDNNVLKMMEKKPGIRHVYHWWINPNTGRPYEHSYGKFSKNLSQAKQRTVETYYSGMKDEMIPATTNLGELIGIEIEDVIHTNSARNLAKHLYGIKGDSGATISLSKGKSRPLKTIESWSLLEKKGLTEGYTYYNSKFLDKPVVFEGVDGNKVIMEGAIGIQDDIYPYVRSYLESPTYGTFSNLNFAMKSWRLALSLFHVMSLGMQELASLRIPFIHINRGKRLAKELGVPIRLLHQEGLDVFERYEDFGQKEKFFEGETTAGKIGNIVSSPAEKIRDFTFGYVQKGMKIAFVHDKFMKLLPEYLDGTGMRAEEALNAWDKEIKLPEEVEKQLFKCARQSVLIGDNLFSGGDYKRNMLESSRWMINLYYKPEARKIWQNLLLSPTWQVKHIQTAVNVFESFIPESMAKKIGIEDMGVIKKEYRKYALGAMMVLGATNMWNYMATQQMDGKGKHMWENPPGKKFAVRAWFNYPKYSKIDRSGNIKHYDAGPGYIRPIKSLFEVAEWGEDPFQKFSYKIAPPINAIASQFFNPIRRYEGWDLYRRAIDFSRDSSMPITLDAALRYDKGEVPGEAIFVPVVGAGVSKLKVEQHKKEIGKKRPFFDPNSKTVKYVKKQIGVKQ